MDTTAAAESIVKILTENFAFEEQITPTTKFADVGLDSLVMLELAVLVERRYGVRFSEDELLEAGSVANVVALLAADRAEQRHAG